MPPSFASRLATRTISIAPPPMCSLSFFHWLLPLRTHSLSYNLPELNSRRDRCREVRLNPHPHDDADLLLIRVPARQPTLPVQRVRARGALRWRPNKVRSDVPSISRLLKPLSLWRTGHEPACCAVLRKLPSVIVACAIRTSVS